jgi:microcystin degradation protein MlrC
VLLAEKAGVGNTISGKLGGKTDTIHGSPIEVKDAYVKLVTDGKFINVNPVYNKGSEVCSGKSVRVKIGNVDVIVASVRFQVGDDRAFMLHGVDVREYKIIALKSTMHFRAVFDDIAKEIITADPPGIHTANFFLLPYKKLSHPIYPLDGNFELTYSTS